MAGLLKLRALVGFYRVGPDGRFVLVQPGEVFKATPAEAADLLSWQRVEPADAAAAAHFSQDTRPSWTRLTLRDGS